MSLRNVYLIDDGVTDRRSVASQLTSLGAESWSFDNGSEFLEMLDHLPPACILLDMEMPGLGGLEVLAELVRRELDWPVIAISGSDDLRIAISAMGLGAVDFLTKPLQADRLGAALAYARSALEQSLQSRQTRVEAQERVAKLTPRERDIAVALLSGQANKIAAHALGISVRTVEMHRAKIQMKLGARSMAEAAVLLMQAGIVRGAGEDPLYRRKCALHFYLDGDYARKPVRAAPRATRRSSQGLLFAEAS